MAGNGSDPFSGLPHCPVVDGAYYDALHLPTPWTPAILGQLFNHSVTCCWGVWPGNMSPSWLWFHNGFFTTEWIYVYEEEYQGDHHTMNEATFMAHWLGTLFASARAGEFTPYT